MWNFNLICENNWDFEVECKNEHFFTITSYIATIFQSIDISEYTIFYTKNEDNTTKILVRFKGSTLYHMLSGASMCATIKMKVDNYVNGLSTCSVKAYLKSIFNKDVYCYYLKVNGVTEARIKPKENYTMYSANSQGIKIYSRANTFNSISFYNKNLKIFTSAKTLIKDDYLSVGGIDIKLVYSHSPKNWGDVEHRYGRWSAVSTLETWGQVMTSKIA